MAIMSVARFQFHPARVAEGIENAKKAKEIFLANGAESVHWGNVLAGTGPGEWTLFIRYPDLATMEEAFKAAMANPEFAKVFMDPDPPASLTDRTLYTLVDL
jgi:hypothetical protein